MGGFQSEEMRQKFFSAKGYGLQVEDLPELDLISNIDGAGKDKVPRWVAIVMSGPQRVSLAA